ncbi:putative nucleic acid-binding protein [Knoellia remsis]|uniref:Ribonuclease VapC n=1 Tax=Knoellia remsis TaxID=407159 RepID=A0A2T0UN05_9MICO|nr:PIN domain-containing protein [Knoellia remsis]PRY59302.1 putative nucleic acid-binding protein [Knoellia remsis]
MIVLDAGVLIAFFDPTDARHDAAAELVIGAGGELVMSPLNLAEVLVRAAQVGRAAEMHDDVRALGVRVVALPDDAPGRLAELRARSGLRMPDCCVLLTAQQVEGQVATFDARLGRGAATVGVSTFHD